MVDLLLRDYAPLSALRVAQHVVSRPRFPVVDTHNHVGSVWGGPWADRPAAELASTLDEAGVEILVDLAGTYGDVLSREIERFESLAGRIPVFAGLDYGGWARDPEFGYAEAERLRDSASRGARGLKVWKPLGLGARDPGGRLVAVDDARLDPLWSTAADLGMPVVIHVGDPAAFFKPLDSTNERWEELQAHPDWHFWPTRAAHDQAAPGFPPLEEVLAGFGTLVARHPKTTFVGAHVASSAEDLEFVGRLLDANPNLSVDIAERIGELGRQPYSARAFFLKYQDRILFGLDLPPDRRTYQLHYRFLETFDESFDYGTGPMPRQGRWQIHGIGLPDDVLRKVYRENARRVLALA